MSIADEPYLYKHSGKGGEERGASKNGHRKFVVCHLTPFWIDKIVSIGQFLDLWDPRPIDETVLKSSTRYAYVIILIPNS